MEIDLENIDFQKVLNLINHTDNNIFLTGRAGTGKTTLLKYIKENLAGDIIVTAPTGIAAINAGGVTLHSFFQLPFGPIMPNDQRLEFDTKNKKESPILHFFKFRKKKIDLIKNMRLLIIDEISMVRSDVLDAIDKIMRAYRKDSHKPFGGVQLLMIGDNFQLPPVTDRQLSEIMREFYISPFFFDSYYMKNNPPVVVELEKIYRQKDNDFIDLLNRVRENKMLQEDFILLNSKFNYNFIPQENDAYITLSTHNAMVDRINKSELAKLDSELQAYDGLIDGTFSEKNLPTKQILHLKNGSQVMFIRNDKENPRRYFNGTIGKIVELGEKIIVKLDTGKEIEVAQEVWENIEYKFNTQSKQIEENTLGQFTQFPLKLAWAVTVHKSQGLTFEKVILDISNSFSPGQAYVALSRCTNLDGIVLKSKIFPSSIKTSNDVLRYFHEFKNTNNNNKTLF